MKKIIAIFLMLVLIATSVAAVTTTQKTEENIEADEEPIYEKYQYKTQIKSNLKDDNFREYPTKPFPAKTQEQLDKMIEDPQMTVASNQLPPQFSWMDFGGDWTTGAKDQGNCGSCWAFGALGALEGAIDIASGNPNTNKDLSEQYVLSCLSAAGSCSGGWMSDAIEYIQSTNMGSTGNGVNGVTVESCMPYTATDTVPCSDKCADWDYKTDPPQEDNKLWEVLNYGVTQINPTSPSDWDLLKSWIYTYGPLSIDIYASSGWRNFGWSHHSPTDVYEPSGSDSGMTDHAQVLCGWVDDPDIKNGGYFIIKNSWGTGFGYGGFTNVAYGTISLGDRDVTWVTAPAWPLDPDHPGIPDVEMRVFADFDYETEDGSQCPHLGEEVEFTDTSEGNVATYDWDFDGDGIFDVSGNNENRPTWTYNQEGDYEVTLQVTSEWGLTSNITRIVGVYEVWPPIAVIEPDQYPDPERPKNDLIIHFDARYSTDPDGGNIVDYHWDFGDGTTSDEVYLNHEFPDYDEIYEVTLTLTDDDGGVGTDTCIVKIDKTVPPETTINHGFGDDGSTWYSETQRISLTATDWTRVIYTYYRIDGGAWIRYIPQENQHFPVSSEGMHTVEAYSVDYYNNEEIPVVDTFGIDKTLPTLDVTINPEEQIDNLYLPPVEITMSAQDSLSGVDSIQYKINKIYSDDWTDYTGPITITEGGAHYIQCIATDNAGNTVERDFNILIDFPPNAPRIEGLHKTKVNEENNFTFELRDTNAGDQLWLYVDWGDGDIEDWIGPYDNFETITLKHTYTQKDNYVIRAQVKDQHDVLSEETEFSLTVEKSKGKYLPLLDFFLRDFPLLRQILYNLYYMM